METNSIEREIALYQAAAYMTTIQHEDEDLLKWWKDNKKKTNPLLAKLTKKVLNIPAFSATSERLFSSESRIYEERHTSLTVEKLQQLVFLQFNAMYFLFLLKLHTHVSSNNMFCLFSFIDRAMLDFYRSKT